MVVLKAVLARTLRLDLTGVLVAMVVLVVIKVVLELITLLVMVDFLEAEAEDQVGFLLLAVTVVEVLSESFIQVI
jgi:hypothetical protein